MTGDCHVRLCESRGVRFPPATLGEPTHSLLDREFAQLAVGLESVRVVQLVEGRITWEVGVFVRIGAYAPRSILGDAGLNEGYGPCRVVGIVDCALAEGSLNVLHLGALV